MLVKLSESIWKPSGQLIEFTTQFVLSCSIEADIYTNKFDTRVSGKLAECAAVELSEDWLKFIPGEFISLTIPDYTILKWYQRNYDPDLTLLSSSGESIGIHIKCYFEKPSEYKTNWQSWCFRKADPCVKGTSNPLDIFLFLKQDTEKNFRLCWTGNIKSDLFDMRQFKDMRLKSKHDQCAVYNSDLQKQKPGF